VTADGKVQQRVLKVERSIGNSWLVNQGVTDGDRVIVEGVQRVRDGQDVNVALVTVDDASGNLEQASAADAPQSGQRSKADGTDEAAVTGSTN